MLVKFNSVEQFKKETQELIPHLKPLKISALRTGIARANGFKNTQAYTQYLESISVDAIADPNVYVIEKNMLHIFQARLPESLYYKDLDSDLASATHKSVKIISEFLTGNKDLVNGLAVHEINDVLYVNGFYDNTTESPMFDSIGQYEVIQGVAYFFKHHGGQSKMCAIYDEIVKHTYSLLDESNITSEAEGLYGEMSDFMTSANSLDGHEIVDFPDMHDNSSLMRSLYYDLVSELLPLLKDLFVDFKMIHNPANYEALLTLVIEDGRLAFTDPYDVAEAEAHCALLDELLKAILLNWISVFRATGDIEKGEKVTPERLKQLIDRGDHNDLIKTLEASVVVSKKSFDADLIDELFIE